MSMLITVVFLSAIAWASWVLTGRLSVRLVTWVENRRARADEPDQFDARDELAEHFESAKRALVDLIPAAPLCPPALRRWKEIEAGLCSDREFIPGVDAVLRDSNQT